MAVAPIQQSRLGRGLASLIGEPVLTQPRLPAEGQQRVVAIDQVHGSSSNPRRTFREDDLMELADSIRQNGIVQPIIVRADPAGGFEIVAGERRWRASQRAGLHHVPVIIRELTDQQLVEFAIIENVQRADLNAIEEASGYQDLITRFDYTQEKLSEVIGKSRSHLANTLRLLKLPEAVRVHVQEGRLSAGHARALVGREDAETLADRIIEQNLNVRDVEQLVQRAEKGIVGAPASRNRVKDADTKAFEKALSDTLGLKAEIKRGSGESGLLIIKYGNFDQLEYIRQRLVGGES
jgi:ParB family transcriptional regulator, chromosome partitioning protein